MKYQFVPTEEADNDVFDIACYLSDQQEDLGFRFYECVDATYQQIVENPKWTGLGHFRQAELRGIRICPVKKFSNHLVFYRIEADKVVILRVFHGARDYMNLFNAVSAEE
jgi:toxin ParE1/3/4